MGAPLTRATPLFVFGCDFIIGLGKPVLTSANHKVSIVSNCTVVILVSNGTDIIHTGSRRVVVELEDKVARFSKLRCKFWTIYYSTRRSYYHVFILSRKFGT